MIEESETPDVEAGGEIAQDVLAARRARRAEGDPVAARRAEAAEAAVRNLETHLAALERRLEEVGSERERVARQLTEREGEVRGVKQREYAEQQLRVEADERTERVQRELGTQIQELRERLEETDRHARELSLELDGLRERDAKLASLVRDLIEVAAGLRAGFEHELAELREELQRQVVWERETYVRELTAMGARMEDMRFELAQTATDLRAQLNAESLAESTLLHHTTPPDSQREAVHRQEMADALVAAVERLRARVAEVQESSEQAPEPPSVEVSAAEPAWEQPAGETSAPPPVWEPSSAPVESAEGPAQQAPVAEPDVVWQTGEPIVPVESASPPVEPLPVPDPPIVDEQTPVMLGQPPVVEAPPTEPEPPAVHEQPQEVAQEPSQEPRLVDEQAPVFEPPVAEPPAEEELVAAEEAAALAPPVPAALSVPLVESSALVVPPVPVALPAPVAPPQGIVRAGSSSRVVLRPRPLLAPKERTSWLAPAIRRLAEQRDAKLAAELVIELLPAQRQIVDGPLKYEIKIDELGTFHVTLDPERAIISREGSSSSVDFSLEGSAAAMSELAGGGAARRKNGLRIRKGRRRARRLLKARREPVALTDLAGAQIDMWPGLLLLAMAEAIDPTWTTGRRFELGFEVANTNGIVIYVRICDGDPILVSRSPTGKPVATVTLTEHALMCLLAGIPAPAGDEAHVSGDVTSVEMFLQWTARAQGLSS